MGSRGFHPGLVKFRPYRADLRLRRSQPIRVGTPCTRECSPTREAREPWHRKADLSRTPPRPSPRFTGPSPHLLGRSPHELGHPPGIPEDSPREFAHPPRGLGRSPLILVHSVGFRVHSEHDLRHSHLGLEHSDLDSEHSDLGPVHSDFELVHSDCESRHSYHGLEHSDRGLVHSHRGTVHSYLGPNHSRRGLMHSDRGLEHSPAEANHSDLGSPHSDRDANAPNLWGEEPWTFPNAPEGRLNAPGTFGVHKISRRMHPTAGLNARPEKAKDPETQANVRIARGTRSGRSCSRPWPSGRTPETRRGGYLPGPDPGDCGRGDRGRVRSQASRTRRRA